MMLRLINLVLLAIVLVSTASAESIKVTHVVDGDTFKSGSEKYRLVCIDSFELLQPEGKEAKKYLSSLILHKTIDVKVLAIDKYNRLICTASVDGTDLGELIVTAGWATLYHSAPAKCSTIYGKAVEKAQASKVGAWAGNPTDPFVFRKNLLRTYGE